MITRDEALDLLRAHGIDGHMLGHSLASEAVMRAMARALDEDEVLWGLAGLLHDLGYVQTKSQPDRHGTAACEALKDSLPPGVLLAIAARNAECTGVQPEERLDFALRAAETVTGLIQAASLVRPDGFAGMEARSVKKKMKDKAFAANVNRERIRECEKLGLSLDDFLSLSITAMAAMPR